MACPARHHARLGWALLSRIAILDTRVPIILHFEKKPNLLIYTKASSQKLGLLGSQLLLQDVLGVQAMQGDKKELAQKICLGARVQQQQCKTSRELADASMGF